MRRGNWKNGHDQDDKVQDDEYPNGPEQLRVLMALSDDGHPAYNNDHAVKIAGMHCPVFGCTPDQFPDQMAVALTGRDVEQWAASRDIALVRGQ